MDDNKNSVKKNTEENPSVTEYPSAERKWILLIVVVALALLAGFFIFK